MTEQPWKDCEKKPQKQRTTQKKNTIKHKLWGDWVWSNDTNMRAEDMRAAHESILCSETSLAYKGIHNTFGFFGYFFFKKSNIIVK